MRKKSKKNDPAVVLPPTWEAAEDAGIQLEIQDETQPEVQDEPQPEMQDEPQPEAQDEPQPEVQDEPQPEVQDEPQSEAQDEPLPVGKTGSHARIQWIDVVKGITILCTIVGHTIAGRARKMIFSFHMPMFFLLSGYTMKQVSWDDLPSATWKDFKRLILPVFAVRGVFFLLYVTVGHIPVSKALWDNVRRILWGNGNDYGPVSTSNPIQLYGVGVIWFLIALFWSKLAYRCFLNLVREHRLLIAMFLALAGMWAGGKLRLPQCVDMIPVSMLFMEFGRLLREKIDLGSEKWFVFGVLSFFVWTYLVWEKGIYIEMATRVYPLSMVSVLIALLACAVMIQFGQTMEKTLLSRPLRFLGRYSLELLCIHCLDSYLMPIWHLILFTPGSRLGFMNSVLTSILRLVVDILVLALLLILRKYFGMITEKIKERGALKKAA